LIFRFKESLFLPPCIPGSLHVDRRVAVRHRACRVYKTSADVNALVYWGLFITSLNKYYPAGGDVGLK